MGRTSPVQRCLLVLRVIGKIFHKPQEPVRVARNVTPTSRTALYLLYNNMKLQQLLIYFDLRLIRKLNGHLFGNVGFAVLEGHSFEV